ncbi:lysin A [Microbacterium phage Smarties]|uniref:Lysin A n=1 Tax=Microbacterium phage Ariadne TaxID=2656546 RepID=A0A649VBP4_9CAUD|nr:lysin A [Microbacterium phage Ariadne]QGJ89455.1 lysin A [Microbacterium phage Ariadne]QGJ91442.1 lysin A [Microbacterium phage Smarties]
MGVNGMAAAQTLLDYDRVTPGYCLMYVWQAYKAHGARAEGSYPTAYSAWLGSPGKHPGDWNPPAGVPVYFGPKASSSAGDVVISIGNGQCVATDWPVNGVTNITTLAARQRQIGRPYLGWTDNILGYPIDYNTASGGGGGGDDMGAAEMAKLTNIEAILVGTGPSLTDPNFIGGAGSIYNRLLNLSAHVYAGGPSAADPNYLGAPGTLYALAKAPVNRTVIEGGKPVTKQIMQIQDNADTNTFARQILALVQQLVARPVVEFTDEQTDVLADGLAAALVERGVGGASKDDVREALVSVLGNLVLRPDPAS